VIVVARRALLTLFGFVSLSAVFLFHGACQGQTPPGTKVLPSDEELLRDLQKPHDAKAARQAPAGEDITAPEGSAESPLVVIRQKMTLAGTWLQQGDTGERTQNVQQEVLAWLRRLMSEQNTNSSASPQDTAGTATQQAASQTNTSASGDAVRNTGENGRSQTASSSSGTAEQQRRSVWGHLPERLRQQLQSLSAEEFLPEYRELIEAYYRRLGELTENNTRGPK
jgi:hypothetical protein